MENRHFIITDTMTHNTNGELDWSIAENTRKLVQMSEDFSAEYIAAQTMCAFIGHACETSEGDVLMYCVDSNGQDEDTCIFITNRCANPLLRDRRIIPNHRYVIFKNIGKLYELHYVKGTKVPQAIPGIGFEFTDKDPQKL
ncbi:MAG: hypothetical protein NC548_06060 [Lachnospiraceae bacterium]|nr:hypothetical protein [Lachnospiraceae bacterium]